VVSSYFKRVEIERLIHPLDRELTHFGLVDPRRAVAAPNPHGSEGSLFGSEEATEMIPAIEACRA
jgi:4-phospho-D-threonate 3-dehydrogenase / 4-phospho-D-erythronate 3-dehydrogenase